jgi:hypothetical protein
VTAVSEEMLNGTVPTRPGYPEMALRPKRSRCLQALRGAVKADWY